METSKLRKRTPATTLLDPAIVVPAIGQAFVKLDPRTLMKNPVMFVLEIVSALTTAVLARDIVTGGQNIAFELQIVCGCGSPCCLPISPRRWLKGGARRRPIRCARPAPKRAPSAS